MHFPMSAPKLLTLSRRRQHTRFAYVLIPLQDKVQVQPTNEIKNSLTIPSAHILYPRPRHPFFSGRADNACTNLLGYFVHFVRTRGMYEIAEDSKSANFAFILYRTHSPRMARATDSCTPPVVVRRTARVLLADYCRAFRQ